MKTSKQTVKNYPIGCKFTMKRCNPSAIFEVTFVSKEKNRIHYRVVNGDENCRIGQLNRSYLADFLYFANDIDMGNVIIESLK